MICHGLKARMLGKITPIAPLIRPPTSCKHIHARRIKANNHQDAIVRDPPARLVRLALEDAFVEQLDHRLDTDLAVDHTLEQVPIPAPDATVPLVVDQGSLHVQHLLKPLSGAEFATRTHELCNKQRRIHELCNAANYELLEPNRLCKLYGHID